MIQTFRDGTLGFLPIFRFVPSLSHASVGLVDILQYFSQALRRFCKRVPARCTSKHPFEAAPEKQPEDREYEDRVAETSDHFRH